MGERFTMNEPTTGEIVRNFRGACIFGITASLERAIIDRLESQDKTIAELTEKIKGMESSRQSMIPVMLAKDTRIRELTARAESAKRERDAAIADMTGFCTRCKYWTYPNDEDPCLSCVNAETGNQNWKWRGLQPQDGGGK